MYGKSPEWARRLLLGWLDEQNAGGEVRVIVRKDTRGRTILETTRGVLQRYMPPARDMALVRTTERLDKDVDFLTRRVNTLAARCAELEKLIARLRR